MDKLPWIIDGFLSICLFISGWAALYAEEAAMLSAKSLEWSARLYGFNVQVEVTPRAVTICHRWNLFMSFVIAFILGMSIA